VVPVSCNTHPFQIYIRAFTGSSSLTLFRCPRLLGGTEIGRWGLYITNDVKFYSYVHVAGWSSGKLAEYSRNTQLYSAYIPEGRLQHVTRQIDVICRQRSHNRRIDTG